MLSCLGHATHLLEVARTVALLELNHKFIQWPAFQHNLWSIVHCGVKSRNHIQRGDCQKSAEASLQVFAIDHEKSTVLWERVYLWSVLALWESAGQEEHSGPFWVSEVRCLLGSLQSPQIWLSFLLLYPAWSYSLLHNRIFSIHAVSWRAVIMSWYASSVLLFGVEVIAIVPRNVVSMRLLPGSDAIRLCTAALELSHLLKKALGAEMAFPLAFIADILSGWTFHDDLCHTVYTPWTPWEQAFPWLQSSFESLASSCPLIHSLSKVSRSTILALPWVRLECLVQHGLPLLMLLRCFHNQCIMNHCHSYSL